MVVNPNFNKILSVALESNKPSNADRIRAMSDEELADLLVHNPWMREESALKWLKSPAGGDGDGR